MRAVLYVDKETGTTVGEVPDPAPGPADVIVAVEACGLCGSDVHAVQNGNCAPGQVLGHEFSGRIVALGSEVTGWSEGQAVAASPIGSCGTCRICARGLPFRCPAVENIGITIPGAYAAVRQGAVAAAGGAARRSCRSRSGRTRSRCRWGRRR